MVARGHEVGLRVDVRGDVVRSLRGEVREELEEGACDFQGRFEGRGEWLFVGWDVAGGLGGCVGC